MQKILTIITTVSVALSWCQTAFAEDDEDLAKKLANPIASLISVPIQANFDDNIGANDNGSVWRINVQPVIPVSIGEDWNLISRTILPVVVQDDIPIDGAGELGLGDVVQSFFFSPKQPTSNGLVWGVGPVLLLNTASDDALGSRKWGMGLTAVALKQDGAWTYGMLANHIESFAGHSHRSDISATFIQPFVSYITETKTTFSLASESTYDWGNKNWSVPVNFTVSQLLRFGDQIIQIGGGVRYWAESPDYGAEDWGARLQITFLFPK